MAFCLCIVCICCAAFTSMALPVMASTGEPIFFNTTDRGPAHFSFSVPLHLSDGHLTIVTHPSGEEMFYVVNQAEYRISSYYKDRIVGLQLNNKKITFFLNNVTPDDAGDYSCRKDDSKGPLIPDCGQTLHFTGPHSSPPIAHCRGDHSPAHFKISMPPSSFGLTNLIVHPSGKVFISREKHYFPRRDMEFTHRIHSLERHGDSVSFSLINVHREDAGEYVCREGSVTGRQIRECGQRLHFIDLEQPYVRHSTLPVDGEELRLGCEVYVPDQAAELGLNFSFHWSRDGQPISGQHDRVLAFHPVSWSDRGLYSCRVKENTRGCGSSPESTVFSLNPIVPPTVSVRRHQHRAFIEVEAGHHMTLTGEVKAAFPPVPPNGFTWTFTSDSSHARQLSQTGDTLTLGPMTREDSGQYTCQARNDQDFPHTWRHGEDSVNITVYVRPPEADKTESHSQEQLSPTVSTSTSPINTRMTDGYANSRTQELEDVNGAATLLQHRGTAVILIILPFLL